MDKSQLRRFLFEKDKEKQTNPGTMSSMSSILGVPSQKSAPGSIGTSFPKEHIVPSPHSMNLGMPGAQKSSIPHPSIPKMGPIQPTAAPSLPGMDKMARFGKLKKYLKREF